MGSDEYIQGYAGAGTQTIPIDMLIRIHQLENKHEFRFVPESYSTWIVASVLLSSFAAVINSDKSQPYLATFLCGVGLAFLIWATPMFFLVRWPVYNRWMMIALIFLVLILVAVEIWIIIRIWIPFTPTPAPQQSDEKEKNTK